MSDEERRRLERQATVDGGGLARERARRAGHRSAVSLDDLARMSLVGFAGLADPAWAAHPHARLIAEKLEDVARRRIKRLMISCPPQHGKSQLSSRFFPAWFLGNNPTKKVILASYEASFAALWGGRARDLLTALGPRIFGVNVRQNSKAADHWETDQGGIMHTAGAGGPVTGHGADVLILEDPVKNREEAESETMRKKLIEWYRSVAMTRLSGTGAVILIMTRWHEGDLAGWLLENEADQWEQLVLPAIALENDPLGRAPGEPLCEALHPLAQLEEFRRTAGSYVWASVFQQKPSPAGGGLFKREHAHRYRIDPGGIYRFDDGTFSTRDQMTRFITVDTACSEDSRADYTAIGAWGVTWSNRLVLLDALLEQIEAPAIVARTKTMALRWGCIPWIEDTTQSMHLLSFMEKFRIPFRRFDPGSSNKFARAVPASALLEQGVLVLPLDAPWLELYEKQLFAFPSGEKKDAVDMTSCATHVFLTELQRSETLKPSTGADGPRSPVLELAPPRPW